MMSHICVLTLKSSNSNLHLFVHNLHLPSWIIDLLPTTAHSCIDKKQRHKFSAEKKVVRNHTEPYKVIKKREKEKKTINQGDDGWVFEDVGGDETKKNLGRLSITESCRWKKNIYIKGFGWVANNWAPPPNCFTLKKKMNHAAAKVYKWWNSLLLLLFLLYTHTMIPRIVVHRFYLKGKLCVDGKWSFCILMPSKADESESLSGFW